MSATNNGGSLERVPGFDTNRVMSQGMGGRKIAPRFHRKAFALATSLTYDMPQAGMIADERAQVTATSEVPWRSICQLLIEGMSDDFLLGTGWLAGPDIIVTAGHNILSPKSAAGATRIHVFPARNANIAPFGKFASSRFAVHPEWQRSRDIHFDYGVIRLQESVGERAGWFGMSALDDVRLRDLILNNAGYPSDRPMGTLWFDSGRTVEAQPNMLLYDLQTQFGQSGSPVFFRDDKANRFCVAIHAYGGTEANQGVRVTRDVIAHVQHWSNTV